MTMQYQPNVEQLQNLQQTLMMMQLLQQGQKNDPARTGPVGGYGPYAHGPTGLFTQRGLDDTVFSSMRLPLGGLAAAIPQMPAGTGSPSGDFGGVESPLMATITGVTKGNSELLANQKVNVCDDAPLAGNLEQATFTAPYGRFSARIELNIRDVGRLQYADEPMVQLFNNPISPNMPFMPNEVAGSPNLNRELDKKLFEAMVSHLRYFQTRMYPASPANDTAGKGYKEFEGIELQINTGKVDIYGNTVAAADSIVEDMNYALIGGSTQVFERLEWIEYRLRERARRIYGRRDAIDLVAIMTETNFKEFVESIPVQKYHEAALQSGLLSGSAVSLNISGNEMLNDRDRMFEEQYIILNGRRISVIIDDYIPEEDSTGGNVAAGQYASDIYLACMSVNGTPVTYWEAFNQANRQAEVLALLMGGTHTWTSDGGTFRWYQAAKKGCMDLEFEYEPRLIIRTPYLWARLQNVAASPIYRVDSADPDSGYFLAGGATNTAEDTFYTDWSTATPVTVHGR